MLINFDFSSKTGILVVMFAFATGNLKIETLHMRRRFARVFIASELPLVQGVLSDDLEIVFFSLEKAIISSFKLLQRPHFVRETSNQHPHFFPRCSSGGKKNTSTDHKT